MLQEIFGDTQTTITSLSGGIAGALSDRVGTYAIAQFGGSGESSLGAVGLEFCGRALLSAAVYVSARNLMPVTSTNVFFTYLFFRANRGLTESALSICNRIVDSIPSPGGGNGKAATASCKCKNE